MSGAGRPLRFLASVAGGWTLLRVGLLWYATGSLPQAMREAVPLPVVAEGGAPAALSRRSAPHADARAMHVATSSTVVGGRPSVSPRPPRASDPTRVQIALLAMMRFDGAHAIETVSRDVQSSWGAGTPLKVSPATLMPRPERASRWSGSAWAILRDGRGIGASADAPQLGGAQAGVRIDYAVRRNLALTARAAAPAAGAGRELSAGVAWRPRGVPLRLAIEQRIALDEGRGGTAAGASGGVGNVPVAAGFALEAYAQGGIILRQGVEHYADGIARVTRRVGGADRLHVDLGLGAWGGTQRGATRFDSGPTASVTLPIMAHAVRVSLDWRQRIAGGARPGSGPALSIGSDF